MNKLGLVKFSSNSTVPMNDRILIKLIHTQRWAVASNSLVIYITISGNGCLQYEVLHQSMQNTADHSSCVKSSAPHRHKQEASDTMTHRTSKDGLAVNNTHVLRT